MNIFEAVHIRKAFAAIAIVFMSLSTVALAAEEPIPGIDVVVRKKPSGATITVKTDKNGRFSVSGLAPGEYDLAWSIPPNAAGNKSLVNTSHSNIRHQGLAVSPTAPKPLKIQNPVLDGHSLSIRVTITAATDSNGKVISGNSADTHQSIVIRGNQGVISGTVVSAVH